MNCTLLTGAGFSVDFGGKVSSKMNQLVYNKLNTLGAEEEVFNLFESSNNYEDFIHNIRRSTINENQKSIAERAIINSYKEMDGDMLSKHSNPSTPSTSYMSLFFDLFWQNGNGCVFTLNQDLLVERYYQIGQTGNGRFSLAVIGTTLECNGINVSNNLIDRISINYNYTLNNNRVNYIKLHGSLGWHENGNERMVIGGDKAEQINNSTILTNLYDIFKNNLGDHNRLLTIGYSYNDDHINKIIKDSNIDYYAIMHGGNTAELSTSLNEKIGRRPQQIWFKGSSDLFPRTHNSRVDFIETTLKNDFFDIRTPGHYLPGGGYIREDCS